MKDLLQKTLSQQYVLVQELISQTEPHGLHFNNNFVGLFPGINGWVLFLCRYVAVLLLFDPIKG